MLEDPIVAEVRAVRDAHARKFNYDLDAIYADIKNSEQKRQAAPRPRPALRAAGGKKRLPKKPQA